NYTFQTNFILDEVPVLVTYESDIEEATQLLIEAARVHAEIAIKETGEEPYVRAELGDSGIRLRLRYQTLAKERQKISSAIVFDIVNKFGGNDKVEFAYPHTEVIYRPKGGPVAKEA
ncbi:MAG: mechanosensitive ion channel family protein, partial [Candidatus Hydrogenedentota bacterium]